MEEMNWAQQLTGLAGVIVGGLVGVAGGLAGARYAATLNEKAQKSALLRTKLEDAVIASFEVKLWLKKEENWFWFKGPEVLEHPPLGRSETIAKLYFPALLVPLTEFALAVNEYRQYLITVRQAFVQGGKTGPSDADVKGLSPLYAEVLVKHAAFLDTAKNEMSIHARS